jgi:pimeloyl-ACP methyl ester carboxylesterase
LFCLFCSFAVAQPSIGGRSLGRSRGSATTSPGETFDARGVKIRYVVEGQGEPVVLIHGLYSSVEMNWKVTKVIDVLAKDHQVIALDLPGHGKSDRPDSDSAYGLQMADDVVLLMDHLKVKKAHIVGYSLGGIIVAKVLERHPDRCLSGTLGGMGWFKEGSMQQKMFEKMKGGKVPPACFQNLGKLALTEEELRKIKAPVKIIVGSKDPCKKMYVAPCVKVRTDWPVAEIEGAGHINCIMKEEFRDEIAQWLRKNKQE